MTAQRPGRRARTSISPSRDRSTGPTVGLQRTSHAVPQFNQGRTGLEGLQGTFSQFFSQIQQAGRSLQEAGLISERSRIERENTEQQRQGQTDALLGRAPPEGAREDLDYADAYDRTLGELEGRRLLTDWHRDVYTQTGPGEDLDARTAQWLRDEFGPGSDSGLVNEAALSTFYNGIQQARVTHAENSALAQVQVGVQNLTANIGAVMSTGVVTPEHINTWIDTYRQLDPLNPNGAAQAVVNILASVSDGNPNAINSVLRALQMPGSGRNEDESFAQAFPDAFREMETSLTREYNSPNSWEGTMALEEVMGVIQNPAASIDDLVGAMVSLENIRSRFGRVSRWDTARSTVESRLEDLIEPVANNNRFGAMVQGTEERDYSFLRSHMNDYLTASGISPLRSSEDALSAARIVGELGVISDDLRNTMSGALMNATDPERQANAYTFYSAIAGGAGGMDYALSLMNPTAADRFRLIYDRASTEGTDVGTIIQQTNQELSDLRWADDVTWHDIVGARTSRQSMAEVDSVITDVLEEVLDSGVQVDPVTMARLRETALRTVIRNNNQGETDWERSVDSAVRAQVDRMEMLPGVDQTNVVRFRPMGTNPDSIPMSTRVYNPSTGEYESTVDTFRSDVEIFARVTGLVELEDPDFLDRIFTIGPTVQQAFGTAGVRTVGDAMAADGLLQIHQNGQPLAIPIGDGEGFFPSPSMITEGQVPASMQWIVDHPSFVLVPFPDPEEPLGYYVGYSPRLGGPATGSFTRLSEVPTSAEQDPRAALEQRAGQLDDPIAAEFREGLPQMIEGGDLASVRSALQTARDIGQASPALYDMLVNLGENLRDMSDGDRSRVLNGLSLGEQEERLVEQSRVGFDTVATERRQMISGAVESAQPHIVKDLLTQSYGFFDQEGAVRDVVNVLSGVDQPTRQRFMSELLTLGLEPEIWRQINDALTGS